MVCLVEDKLYFSLNEEDDLNFVKNGYGKIVFQFEEKQMDYKVRLHLTQPAMLCLGANLIYFAASSLYGYGMRTEPIGDLETASMGIRLAPASGSLFFYQDKGCEELEDIIAEKVLPKDVDEKELFLFVRWAGYVPMCDSCSSSGLLSMTHTDYCTRFQPR